MVARGLRHRFQLVARVVLSAGELSGNASALLLTARRLRLTGHETKVPHFSMTVACSFS
jgi:hypothetical protein